MITQVNLRLNKCPLPNSNLFSFKLSKALFQQNLSKSKSSAEIQEVLTSTTYTKKEER